MARLFLSYRRSDSGAYAERLARHLRRFQFESVFLDRDGIALAEDFPDRIRQDLSQSTAILVLMAKTWLHCTDDTGRRRLEDPADWVRREVSLALSMQLPVVPVLFDGAAMPDGSNLPGELASLTTKQAYDVSGKYFERDADDLARRLERQLVIAAQSAARGAAPIASGVLSHFKFIWIILAIVTGAAAITPAFIPALPRSFWLFPCAMTIAAFLWWLYWMGESLRPARSGAA